MKKLKLRQKIYHARRSKMISARKLTSSYKRKFRKYGENSGRPIQSVKRIISRNGKSVIQLKVPDVLDLSINYNKTIYFINEFREHAIAAKNKRLSLDFSDLNHIGPRAALFLGAEIDRWCRLLNFRPTLQSPRRWNPDVRRLLGEMGLYDLVKVLNAPTGHSGQDGNVSFVRFLSEDQALGERADEISSSIESLSGSLKEGDKERAALYRGLVEAMTNVSHHAYPDDTEIMPTPLKGRWWMSASFHKMDRRVTVSFFDQGVGIPATTVRKHPKEIVRGILSNFGLQNDDASLIQAAMHLGRSRTEQEHRGKGLADIQRFTELAKNGRLTILSGRGSYMYDCAGNHQRSTLSAPIGGTLIHWEAEI